MEITKKTLRETNSVKEMKRSNEKLVEVRVQDKETGLDKKITAVEINNSNSLNTKKVIQSYVKHGGVKQKMCKELNVARVTLDSYLKKNPSVMEFFRELEEDVVDVCEDTMRTAINIENQAVKNGNVRETVNTKWWLEKSKKGRERGFGVKQKEQEIIEVELSEAQQAEILEGL